MEDSVMDDALLSKRITYYFHYRLQLLRVHMSYKGDFLFISKTYNEIDH